MPIMNLQSLACAISPRHADFAPVTRCKLLMKSRLKPLEHRLNTFTLISPPFKQIALCISPKINVEDGGNHYCLVMKRGALIICAR
ncbi:hypothetical protein BDZ91DRAFT_342104 [Kalaharituber pfeilii]|nr:hypothetical protein BDZ91DRAFT_342104 [Kalaharituber pfeilii]